MDPLPPKASTSLKCTNFEFCKGLGNTRNNEKKMFSTHSAVGSCPYQQEVSSQKKNEDPIAVNFFLVLPHVSVLDSPNPLVFYNF